jgi:hypothetical protein
MDFKKDSHPSYGMLGFSRRQGRNISLFGSSIQHNDIITVTLKHGGVSRGLNSDWYKGNGVIAEVEMSYSQFVEAIGAMNVGDGVPCTLRFTERDGIIEKTPFISKKQTFENEFAAHLDDIKNEVNSVINDVKLLFDEKKSIGKNDREEIIKQLKHLEMMIGSNTEFIYRQFNEQMDKTVMEAKGEIEAFAQNKLLSIANAALVEHKEDINKLEAPVIIGIE